MTEREDGRENRRTEDEERAKKGGKGLAECCLMTQPNFTILLVLNCTLL
jgi:hypothetical protein